ncbi:MAG TPA: type II and III secretion system protein, partial [Candidatus Aerophobetes bacterium]|nr:type II and III secretion system protein [Candidatus Aerophobetes bacterium]
IIKMLENENKAKVLSSPRVTTLNNKEAEIFVGDKVPYTVTLVSGGTTTTEVRFIEAGVRLKITPSIIEKDFVVIKIEPEVSYIYTWRGPQDQYPWVKTRQATAYVRVKNGQPFVLGGLLNKEDKKNLYKVPLIGDIPWLGNLFKYEKHTVYDSELIITVTPTIVSGEI